MTIQNRLKHPIQKKAAAVEDKPLESDMIINSNYIDSLQQDSIDIAVNCDGIRPPNDKTSGAICSDETLLNFDGGCYVKRHAFNTPKQSKHTDISPTNVSPKRGLVTPESPLLTIPKTGIDQWTVTFLNVDYRRAQSWINQWINGAAIQQKGSGFYDALYIHPEVGYQIAVGHNVNQSTCVTFKAKSIQHLTEDSKIDMMYQALRMDGKITRLDVWCDFNLDLNTLVETVRDFAESARATRLKVRTIQDRQQGIKGGLTLYIGSNTSPQYWRLYDKGAEQKTAANRWQRFELQANREYAPQLAELLVNSDSLAETITAAVFQKNVWTKPFPWWDSMTNMEVSLSNKREPTTFDSYLVDLGKRVFPKMKMISQQLEIPISTLIGHLINKAPDNSMSDPEKSTLLLDEIRQSLLDNLDLNGFNSTKSLASTKTPEGIEIDLSPLTKKRNIRYGQTQKLTSLTYLQDTCPAVGTESDCEPENIDGSNLKPPSHDLNHSPATLLDGRLSV